MKVFSSWSGGKESCLACYKAILNDFNVSYLLNFISENGKRSRSHGIRSYLLKMQSEVMDIPIVQVGTTWEGYEEKFKKTVEELKNEGIKGGVFGDVDLEEHRDWIERICGELEIEPILPIWGVEPIKISEDFIYKGFKAIVVAAKRREWLGREFDKRFVEGLQNSDIHPCGESGEYHTFVTNGPIFKRGIRVTESKEVYREGTWFLDIKGELR